MSRFLSLVLVCLGAVSQAEEKPLYLTLDTPPAPELSVAEAKLAFSLAPGFAIEPVAEEPLVEDPVAIAWDETGKLYVVEMRGFMPDAYGNNERDPVGAIVRLSDSDGDGVFDAREVLLDGLVLPRAIAIVNEGLLVGEPPNLWLCPSATGWSKDIDCGAKRWIGAYGDQPGSVEHAENGLLAGLDNWLYSAKSDRRLRLRNGELISEPTLSRGQWGITQDNDGRLFYNTNSNLLLGDFFDAQQVVVAGNRTAVGLGEQVSKNDQLFAVRVNTGVNRAYVPGVLRPDGRLNRPTSASGMAAYRGDQFGPEYERAVFVAEPAANAVAHLRLAYDGLSISAEHVLYPDEQWQQIEFLASTDERFRPVDVRVGPDGALYVVDMYRGIIQDHVFLSDELRAQALARGLDKPVGMGRIWRVSKASGSKRAATIDFATADAQRLVAALGHDNAWQRETAQRLLIARNDRGLNRSLKSVVAKGSLVQAKHALWVLEGRGALDRRTVSKALARNDDPLSLSALRAGASSLKRSDLLALFAGSPGAVVEQQLVLSLAAHNEHESVAALLVDLLLSAEENRFLPDAIRSAAIGQELTLLRALGDGGKWAEAREASTRFVQKLVAQSARAQPQSAGSILDYLAETASDEDTSDARRWLQVAVLDGLFDLSREDNFERIELAEAHPIFAHDDEALWPAIARARRSITWPGDKLAANVKPLSPMQQQHVELGRDFYQARCASCHGNDGQGIASLGPPLAQSSWVTDSSERLARIVLHGLHGPIEVAGTTWNGVMPGHGALPEFNDAVASGLLTYLGRSWGHTGRAIDPEFVAGIRAQTAGRQSLWTAEELLALDINTHYERYVGRYGGGGFGLEFVYNGRELEVRSGIFNGPLIEEKEDHFLFEPRALRIEFVLDDAGIVTAIRMDTGSGDVLLPRAQG